MKNKDNDQSPITDSMYPSSSDPVGKSGWINATACGATGSDYETHGNMAAGSNELLLNEAGDFQPGQQVEILGANLHHYGMIYNDREPYLARNQSPLVNEVELRGLSAGKTWQTFVIDFHEGEPTTWRWMAVDPAYQTKTTHHPVLHRHWCWQGEGLPVTGDWFPLCDGVEIRFCKRDWLPGQSFSFHARNQLLTRILERRGNLLRLQHPANCTVEGAVVRHHDQDALQSAVNQAIAERKRLIIPSGHYRLSSGLWIREASLHIEGGGRDNTLLDISNAHTAVFWIAGGREVSVRNLAMQGHTGFLELPANRSFETANKFAFWPTANQQMEIKGCSAVNAVSTENLLFEDLEVSRMASEAFYLHGSDRYGLPPYIQAPHEGIPGLDQQYTRSCIYHRVHVHDCGFNAFNNNDHGENTSILHCRVERVSNFSEDASRFTRVIGNTVIDGCAMGVHGGRAVPGRIGPSQSVIANNVFEGGKFSGGISIGNDATQVIIANNLFVGYSKECAVFVYGGRCVIIQGNHIDLSRMEDNPDNERCGISIEASNVTVADNQIYDRGDRSGKTTGIHVACDATNVQIHDNLIENLGCGLRSGRRIFVPDAPAGESFQFRATECTVTEVRGSTSFLVSDLPRRCDDIRPYVGWRIAWLSGSRSGEDSRIQSYDQETREILLAEECPLSEGDRFAVYPAVANWQIHHNTITACEDALDFEASLPGVAIKDNLTD